MEHITERGDWLNEHGEPDFEYLHALAKGGGPQAIEKLLSIAADLDVECHDGESADAIVDRIRSAADANEDADPIVTS